MGIGVHANDILMGRGGMFLLCCFEFVAAYLLLNTQYLYHFPCYSGYNHQHIGNEQLRNLARARVVPYKRATKKQKAVIVG